MTKRNVVLDSSLYDDFIEQMYTYDLHERFEDEECVCVWVGKIVKIGVYWKSMDAKLNIIENTDDILIRAFDVEEYLNIFQIQEYRRLVNALDKIVSNHDFEFKWTPGRLLVIYYD